MIPNPTGPPARRASGRTSRARWLLAAGALLLAAMAVGFVLLPSPDEISDVPGPGCDSEDDAPGDGGGTIACTVDRFIEAAGDGDCDRLVDLTTYHFLGASSRAEAEGICRRLEDGMLVEYGQLERTSAGTTPARGDPTVEAVSPYGTEVGVHIYEGKIYRIDIVG